MSVSFPQMKTLIYYPNLLIALVKGNLTKEEAMKAIAEEIVKLTNPDAVYEKMRAEEKEELDKLAEAVGTGMGAETAAAAVLLRIANKKLIYGWQKC
jgi:hypothetical protein